MEIPELRDSLVKILQDYNLQVSERWLNNGIYTVYRFLKVS
jgi:hypothetical protein